MRFSKKCYDAMLSGFFGSVLTGYSKLQAGFEKGVLGSEKEKGSWDKGLLSRARRRIIVSYENSGFMSMLSSARDWLLGVQMRFCGFFFLYFGLCSLMMNLIRRFAYVGNDVGRISWIVGALLVFASFPMLASGKNFASAVGESVVFSSLIFKFLGFSWTDIKKHTVPTPASKKYLWAALAGTVFGCASFFISPLIILVGVFGIIWAVTVYSRPETGVLSAVFIAPFLSFIGSPSMALSGLIIFTFVSMCIKVFLGRLRIRLEISDCFVAIFMLIIFMGGAVSVGGVASLKEASVYACLLLIYFMIITLITTREWLGRLSAALVVSGTLTALYGLYQKVSGNMEVGTMDKDMFGDLGGRVTSTFENSNMLGVFLIMVFPFALSYVFSAKKLWVKLLSLASCGVMGICLIYTWSRGAWLGLVLAAFVFVLLYGHYIIPLLLPAGALGVTVLWNKLGGNGLFTNLMTRFSSILTMSDTSSVYRLGIWRGAMKVAGENLFTGIGVGTEAFRKVYIKFAESGIETAVHSHNLFLQIFIENGVVGFAVFIIALLLCISSGLELVRRSSADTAAEKAIAVAAISGLLAALLQGMTDFIWFNYRIFFFFWVITAFISASARIGRRKTSSKSEY